MSFLNKTVTSRKLSYSNSRFEMKSTNGSSNKKNKNEQSEVKGL